MPQEPILKEPKPEDYGVTFQEVEKQGGFKSNPENLKFAFIAGLISVFIVLIKKEEVIEYLDLPHLDSFSLIFLIFLTFIFGMMLGATIEEIIYKIINHTRKEIRINRYIRDKEEYDEKINLIKEKQRYELEKNEKLKEQISLKKKLELEKVERERLRKRAQYWHHLIGKGKEFEDTLAELFMQNGYQVSKTPQSGDEGIDLILKKNGKTTVVQCKAHNKKVSQKVVRELYGSMIHFNANNSILATIIGGSQATKEFCKGKPIKLLTMYDYIKMQDKVSQ